MKEEILKNAAKLLLGGHKRNAFGLNSDSKRLGRLFFQPVLIYWALKSTGNIELYNQNLRHLLRFDKQY